LSIEQFLTNSYPFNSVKRSSNSFKLILWYDALNSFQLILNILDWF